MQILSRGSSKCCPERWISIQTNGTIDVQQNRWQTSKWKNRNKANWIILCEEWKYMTLYIYHICNIEGSTPIYRLNDRQNVQTVQHACNWSFVGRMCWMLISNDHKSQQQQNDEKTKTRKNTRFIKNIQLLFIIKKPNNNRLCFYFVRLSFDFSFSIILNFDFYFLFAIL